MLRCAKKKNETKKTTLSCFDRKDMRSFKTSVYVQSDENDNGGDGADILAVCK